MRRLFKRKSAKIKTTPATLKKAYEELDRTARTLIQTDLKLHQANERFNQQIAQLHALHRLGTFINSTFDVEEIMKTVSDSIAKDLDFEKTGIVFLETKGQKPMQSTYMGFTSAEYTHLLDHFEALIHPALLQEEEVYLQTAAYAPPVWAKLLHTLSLSSLLLLPMRFKSRLIGFIVAGRSHVTVRLTEPERRFYCMYATQVSTAIENARLYEALGQANLTLEEKVQERTRSLIEANERLRELDTAKSNFISLISHELRTPLTAIKGFVMMLFHHDKSISDEKRMIYLNVLNEETDRLTRLITELLDISRIESGRIEFKWESLSIPDRVDRVFGKLSVHAKGARLTKDFSSDFPQVIADSDKLEQVLMNLVVNAVRFSPPGGIIAVRGRPARDGVTLEVTDQGMGIPFNEQEKIFEKFYRLDNDVNRKNPGTGLGLPICRALINLHGGKVWVESEQGQGSRFLISLPLNLDKLPTSNEGPGPNLTSSPRLPGYSEGL
jgi:two-component system sensor histidine kinase/response regulator